MHQRRMKATGLGRVLTSAAALALAGVLALMVVACQPALELSSVIEREVAASAEDSVQPSPAAPSDLAATAISPSEIDLTWVDNSDNEDEFEIQRDSGSGFQGITSVGADSTAFSDSGLDPETEYTYRIRATSSSGASEWTGGVSATTDAPAVKAPTTPSGLTATTQNADQIDLSWSDTSDNEEQFEIQRKEGVGGTYAEVATLSAGTTGYQDTALDSDTTYYYRVRATNSAGSSNWSNEANDTTAQLAAPSGLTASAVSPTQVDLSWTDNSGFESGFDIERDGTVVDTVGADTTSYSDTGLTYGTQYTYRVRAVDAGGTSPWSSEASTTTLAAGDPQSFSAAGITWTMRYVPAKSLPTGTDDSGSATVNADFWLAETEVTYELWYAVREWAENGTGGAPGEGAYTFANPGLEGDDGTIGAGPTGADQEPVTGMNWRDAMLWTNALTEWYNDQTGESLEPVYYSDSGFNTPIRMVTRSTSISDNPGEEDNPYVKSDADGFRLPGVDEWELAARYIEDANADGDIEDSGEYYPGDYASGADARYDASSASQDLDGDGDQDITGDVGWYDDNSGSATHDVGTKDDNALGLYDMSGNVSEWNFDWDPNSVGERVFRGGGWISNANYLQVGSVSSLSPYTTITIYYYGFRPARNAQ